MSARARAALTIALLLLASAGCKPPRPPKEAAAGSVTGVWTATSHPGALRWRLELEERRAGTLAGRGAVAGAGDSTTFTVDGVRAESTLTLKLHLPRDATFRGSILSPDALVGEIETAEGTTKLAFTRK